MSDTPRRIRAQEVASDPCTMRFLLEAPVQGGMSASFDRAEAGAPLAQALFAIDGVRRVAVTGETILVTRAAGHEWQALKAGIAAAIRQVLAGTDRPLGDEPETTAATGSDAALLAAVSGVLDREANPAIAAHGGHVSVDRVEEATVYLRMSGGCQGCAASAVTLRNGVETMLRNAVPGIRGIVDVTDHASGTAPYYRDAPGRSPMLARPVPAGVLARTEGGMAVDPAYLGPRLGLDAEALRAGLASGEVAVTTETAPPAEAGHARVTVRSPRRAWTAEILPDGSAREIPPPSARPAADGLPDRVRRHLDALPPDRLPVTYGQLARSLGMRAPGAIREVTGALETTMHEDAAAGRPFIAARVVNRGPGGIPGKGFFDLARKLGRGPWPEETFAALPGRAHWETHRPDRE